MPEWIAIIHIKEEAYLIDRQAYYILCNIQDVDFGFEDPSEYNRERKKMFDILMGWLFINNHAIKLENTPHHLIIKFRDE
jgi:hypothetical protein